MTDNKIKSNNDIKKYFEEGYFNNYNDYKDNLNSTDKTLYKAGFLQNYYYILANVDQNDASINKIQWKIARDRFLKKMIHLIKDKKISELETFKDIIAYGGIPEKLLPAVYMPFYHSTDNNAESINYNLLTFDDTLPDSFIRGTYKNFPNESDAEYLKNKMTFVDNLRKALNDQIKELDKSDKTYNNFNLQTIIISICILWFIIIITLLKIVNYYYSEYYNVIIIAMTVILLITAIIWKMSNFLRS